MPVRAGLLPISRLTGFSSMSNAQITEASMSKATAQDVLNALTNQRNEALNAVAMAQAELAALRRSLEEPEEPQSERKADEQE